MNTTVLANLIAQKLQVLELLHRLARAQLELIESADMTRLLPVLAAKQKLLAQMQQVEQSLQPFRAEDPDHRQWASATERDHCRANAERCETLLADILHWEREGETQMVRRRDAVAERLYEMQGASEVHNAYAGQPQASYSHFDASSDR